ncbi:MAG: YwiC-like family protein [Acidobacteriia bacterium]|nr:YwiC-like family protein [Terriglobia bacterium]
MAANLHHDVFDMATLPTTVKPVPARKARVRALVIPREHGAWGLLLIPLITGACAGLAVERNWLSLALFTVAALALFWIRTPVESALGASPMRAQSVAETNGLLLAIAVLGSTAMACTTLLLLQGDARLLVLGAAAALAFIAQAVVKKLGRGARMASQLIGSIGLTVTAPAAWYVVTQRLDATALGLWLLNWIFAGNQIHFVQLRIHAARAATRQEKVRRGRGFLIGQFAMIAALLAAWRLHLVPGLALLAFIPLLVRGLLWFKAGARPLVVKRLGWSELAHGVSFGLLLVAAYLL